MVSLVCLCCSWLVLAPKVLQLCINHLVLIFCKFVWIVEACKFFLVPSRSSSTPFYLSKMLRTRERASTPYSSAVFNLGLTFESLKELGACQYNQWTFISHVELVEPRATPIVVRHRVIYPQGAWFVKLVRDLGEISQVPHHRPISRGNQGVGIILIHIINRWDICSIVAHLLMIN
jgi:hypothetical protein